MKKLYSILILTFLSTSYLLGQQTPDAFLLSSNAQPPLVVPQSPEAGNLGRYGSIPITSATGQMSYSVPIHTIQVDGHSWPIGLNYNYGGLLIEGKPSMMGLGWSLLAEAAITREVRGLPDEDQYGYNSTLPTPEGRTAKQLVNDYIALEYSGDPLTQGWDAWNVLTLENFVNGLYDSEADKYSVNVGNLNFSFKLNNLSFDGQGNVTAADVYFLSKHANKVDVEWNPRDSGDSRYNSFISAFTVTDTDGIQYRFEDVEKTVPQGRDAELIAIKPITSWKLSTITYINGQTITFEYDDDILTDYSFRYAGLAQKQNVDGLSENPNGYSFGPFDFATQITNNARYVEDITKGQISRKILSRINFPKGHIVFDYDTNAEGRKLYSNIRLYSEFNGTDPVKHFNLGHSGVRDFLDYVEYNGEQRTAFEYHTELAIPRFIESETDFDYVRSQDEWKFYNGAGNQFAINIPNTQLSGVNKEVNLLYTRLGAMKRIVHPTKGSTNIYYEQNQLKTDFITDSDYYSNLPASDLFTLSLDLQSEAVSNKSKTIEVLYPTVAFISHSIEGNRASGGITLELNRLDGQWNYPITYENETIPPFPGANDFYYNVAPYLKQEIIDRGFPYTYPPMYPNFVKEFGYADTDNGSGGLDDSISEDSGDKILIMPGTYKMEISSITPGADVRGSISIQIYGDFNVPPPAVVNKDVGGIRVDFMKDCPDSVAENCFITDYEYNDDEGISTAELYAIPQLKTTHIYQYKIGNDVNRVDLVSYLSTPFTVSDPGIGTPVFYRNIKTVKRRNGSVRGPSFTTEIGHTENTYSFPAFENALDLYPRRPTGVDLDKSLPLVSKIYKQGSDDHISQTTTQYTPIRNTLDFATGQDENDAHPWSLKVFINKDRFVDFSTTDFSNYPQYPIGSPADIATKELHGVLPYREVDIWDRPLKVINETDDISTATTYGYNANQAVIEKVTLDSRGNTVRDSTWYANDLPELSAMAAKNQLRQPVLSKGYYNDVLLGTRKTEFVSNANGYKPSKVLTAKGDSELEAKMQFSYDSSGKLLQVDRLLDSPGRSGNGTEKVLTSTAYVWGYGNEYPVLKVENATRAEVFGTTATMGTLQSASASLTNKQNQLATLRSALPDAFVHAYTYKPLVGVSQMIDPRGYTTNYQYDDLNRLLNVQDEQDKMLQEYEYAYKSQNYANPDIVEQYDDLGGSIGGPDTVQLGALETYTANVTGGSGDFAYSWYQDNVFLASGAGDIDILFDTGSSAVIRVEITDNVTGGSHTITRTVAITSDLGSIALSADPSGVVVVGTPVIINSSGINQNNGTISYAWFLDGSSTAETFTGATGFQTSFATTGQHTISLVATQNETGTSVSGTMNIVVVAPLPNLTLNASENTILRGNSVTFTTTPLGQHGITVIEWAINGPSGTEILDYQGTGPHTIQFDTAGTYEVVYEVSAPAISQTEQASATITVQDDLTVGALSASTSEIIRGSAITFYAPSISGGSGNRSYEWLVDGTVRSTASGNFTYDQFDTAKNYTVAFKVIDNVFNISETLSMGVVAYDPLNNPAITPKVSHTEIGNDLFFNTSNLGGGSGSYAYEWYVKYGTGTYARISSATGTSFTYDNFSLATTYTIRFRIVDTKVAGHYKQVTSTVNVYSPIQISNSDITTPSPVPLNGSTYFNINAASGGSGSFEYEWDIINESFEPFYYHGVGTYNEANRNVANFVFDDYEYVGSNVKIQCRVRDLLTNRTKTVHQIITVQGNGPISGLTVFSTDTEPDPETANFRLAAGGVTGGSGQYEYRWLVNDVVVQEGTDNIYEYVYLNCSNQSATVKCVAMDALTNSTIIKTVTLNLNFNCGGQ